MDQEELEDLKNTFDDKYADKLEMGFEEWQEKAPRNEEKAYARCMEIDRELNKTYDEWFTARGDKKEEMGEHRAKLKAEYDLIEEMFHLEANDRSW